tara:strand:+ start:1289 stop:2869 length:1581 start_codon:yes stop_codon:yes gene_type:complete
MYSFRKKIDQKLINSFEKLNKFKIEKHDTEKNILLIDRNLPEPNLLSAYFSYILNKKYKYNIFLLTNQGRDNQLNKIYKSFKIQNVFYINIKQNTLKFLILIKSVLCFILSFLEIIFGSRTKFIKNFKIQGIYFGDIIYDHFIRQNNQYERNNLISFSFFKLLFITLYKFFYINELISKHKFNYIISNTHTYASNSAIAMRIALQKNIKVINILSSRIRVYKKLYQSFRSELFFDVEEMKDLKSIDRNWNKKLDIYFNKRFEGKIKHHNVIDAYSNKKRDIGNIFPKNKFKKVILFAPHAFPDANHAFGKLIFDSYYHQFLKTLEIAKKTKEFLWIVKNHPTNHKFKSDKYKFGEEEIVLNKLKTIKNENIFYCPSNLSTKSLIEFSDLIITGRGSIGLETAILGKKALLCGEHFYSNKGITFDPKNIDEYENIICKKKNKTKLSKSKILLAKKLFYIFAFKNSHLKEDMIQRNNYINIVSNKIIKQRFFSVEDYLVNFEKSLRKHKKKILNDRIFKDFEKRFLSI